MCPAEASVGVNAKAVVRGIQREDKNIMGTMHFGLGTNVDVGGSIKSKIHMDGVILEPDALCRRRQTHRAWPLSACQSKARREGLQSGPAPGGAAEKDTR